MSGQMEAIPDITEEIVECPQLGVNIFFASINGEHSSISNESNAPKIDTPFGLKQDSLPIYQNLVIKDPSLLDAVNIMVRPPLAISTIKAYTPAVKKFEAFCEEHHYEFPQFSEPALIHFLAASFQKGEPFTFYSKVVPALRALETTMGILDTAVTSNVKAAVNSLRRSLAVTKPPVKKPQNYSINVLNDLVLKLITPYEDELWLVSSSDFRSILRGLVYYYTWCRFADFKILKDGDFDDVGEYVKIFFKKSKNDQFYNGSTSIIAEQPGSSTCPVRIIRLYFKKFGLWFCDQEPTGTFVNFRIQKTGYYSAIPGTSLSQTTATQQFRELLNRFSYKGDAFTEKSLKVLV